MHKDDTMRTFVGQLVLGVLAIVCRTSDSDRVGLCCCGRRGESARCADLLFFRGLCRTSMTDRKSTRLNSQSRPHLVCRLLLEKKKNKINNQGTTMHTRETASHGQSVSKYAHE